MGVNGTVQQGPDRLEDGMQAFAEQQFRQWTLAYEYLSGQAGEGVSDG